MSDRPTTGLDGCLVVWGASRNSRMTWWGRDGRDVIGWAPQDSADRYADALGGKTSGHAVAERHQGGGYCAMDYGREAPVSK